MLSRVCGHQTSAARTSLTWQIQANFPASVPAVRAAARELCFHTRQTAADNRTDAVSSPQTALRPSDGPTLLYCPTVLLYVQHWTHPKPRGGDDNYTSASAFLHTNKENIQPGSSLHRYFSRCPSKPGHGLIWLGMEAAEWCDHSSAY